MRYSLTGIVALTALVLSSASLNATEPMLGAFNSPKGFGIVLESRHPVAFNTYIIYLDMYGMFSPRTDIPGAKACFSRNYILNTKDCGEAELDLYLGPGCSAGFVQDLERGNAPLERNPGAMLALSCTGGMRVRYKKAPVCLDLSFRSEFGVHFRQDEILATENVSLYMNGLSQTIVPQLSILYCF